MVASRFLGLDMGGTATRWVVVDGDGAIVERGACAGATGHLFNPAERELFAKVIGEIAAAARPIDALQAGITGFGPRVLDDVRRITADAFGVDPARIVASDDVELAYLTVFRPGHGHLVAAGTGSIGLHLRADGTPIRVGGRGILIDDGGSGSWIALRAVDRLYRQIDLTGDPGDATGLARALADSVGGDGWDQMRAFIYGSDRGRIGRLAKAVGDAAAAGDPLAGQVLADAATELARLAGALIARGGPLPVAMIGGVLELGPQISSGIQDALGEASVSFPKIDAALGAARLALAGALT